MRTSEFRVVLGAISWLTGAQRETLLRALDDHGDEVLSEVIEELLFGGVRCPHCESVSVIRWGQANGLPRWRCKGCRRTFNPLTGTSLARLHHRERWTDYAESLRCGETLQAAGDRCGIHLNTSHRWRHRFLRETAKNRAKLAGIAEADETFVLRSAKGQPAVRKAWALEPRTRGGSAKHRGRSQEHVAIIVGRDRSGTTIDQVVEVVDADHIRPLLEGHIEADAIICTDGYHVYRAVTRQLGLRHVRLRTSHGEWVRGPFHIQNVNSYHSRWKNWVRRFHGVATSYLPNYLGWFRELDANSNARTPKFMLEAAFAI